MGTRRLLPPPGSLSPSAFQYLLGHVFLFLPLRPLPLARVDCVSPKHQVLLSADTVLELNKTLTSRPGFESLTSVSRGVYLP